MVAFIKYGSYFVNPLFKLLQPILAGLPAYQKFRESLVSDAAGETYLTNLVPSLDALLVAIAANSDGRPALIIAEDAAQAERLYDDLARLLDEEQLALFSEGAHASLLKRERQKRAQTAEATAQLLEALDRLSRPAATGQANICITIADAESLGTQLPRKQHFAGETLALAPQAEPGFDRMMKWLDSHHFERKQFVETAGDYAVRGGILDVFPFTETVPVRMEFFGDTIDSMRSFDAISQRSTSPRKELVLVPNVLTESEAAGEATLFDYIASNSFVLVLEPSRVRMRMQDLGMSLDLNSALASFRKFFVAAFPPSGANSIDFASRAQPAFHANLKLLREHLTKRIAQGERTIILSESKDLTKRLKDLLDEGETANAISTRLPEFVEPSLAQGFELPHAQIAIYTEHELFGRKRERGASARKRAARTKGISLRELRTLKRGDLLVHEDKGIGKFMGLETIVVGGKKQEVVRLTYRDNDVLFVNLDYIGRLSKYSSGEVAEAPTLSKLGSGEWERTKERTKKRLKDIARNLIQLYAKRRKSEGFAFSADDVIQREMEAAFLYDDTPDQERATEDLKRDMQSVHPMDRLICGDVGYGKTEVAMRAAMKAVLDKKQVAVLVPTTILAEQHFRTFSDRLDRFGVRCAALSRFRLPNEQKGILRELAEGKIDVLIGTHRILSKDVIFKDLGLLIIDEEHRFGVRAKEALREMRANVDTLTLTATPIPRTLNFSLLGARDLSIMETPPRNRLPIMTEVLTGEDNSYVLSEAVKRELARGGQIYAINDKVHDLDTFADSFRRIVPGARVEMVHGEMPPTQIERTMKDFIERRVDILAATKIVESGLDVPNANTMFINRAQNFGLAELYQLRGRVGRSNEQAYCYLLAPPVSRLSQDALRRLEAMEEFSDLGAGFQLAMRDLEIRGAGNLLGAEQSGFIAEIGFDLYQKTVEEAVEELKREEFREVFAEDLAREKRSAFGRKRLTGESEVAVSLGVAALIPEAYIEDDAERFGFYQRMAGAANDEALEEIAQEMRDRFGPLPEEVHDLMHVTKVRVRAKALGARHVVFEEPTRTLRILLPQKVESYYYQHTFPKILDRFESIGKQNVRLVSERKALSLVVRLRAREDGEERIREIEEVLTKLTPELEEPTAVPQAVEEPA